MGVVEVGGCWNGAGEHWQLAAEAPCSLLLWLQELGTGLVQQQLAFSCRGDFFTAQQPLADDFAVWAAQHDAPESDSVVETPHLSGPQRQRAHAPGGKIARTSVSSTLATVVLALGWATNIVEFLWHSL